MARGELRPKHAVAESALHLLVGVMREYAAAEQALVAAPIRLADVPAGSQEPDSLRRESAVVRLVSVAEAFLDARSLELMEADVPGVHQKVALMLNEFEQSSTISWKARKDAYKSYHKLDLSACAAVQKVDAAVQVRNSVVHGLGWLTARQRDKRGLRQVVELVGAKLSGGRIETTPDTVRLTYEACRQLVQWVDERT